MDDEFLSEEITPIQLPPPPQKLVWIRKSSLRAKNDPMGKQPKRIEVQTSPLNQLLPLNLHREIVLMPSNAPDFQPVSGINFSRKFDNVNFAPLMNRLFKAYEAYYRQMDIQLQSDAFDTIASFLLKRILFLLSTSYQISKQRTASYSPENTKITLNKIVNFFYLRYEMFNISVNRKKKFLLKLKMLIQIYLGNIVLVT